MILLKKGSVAKFGRIDDDHQHQINTERTVASHASALFFFFYYYFLVSIVGVCVRGEKERTTLSSSFARSGQQNGQRGARSSPSVARAPLESGY